MAETTIEWTAGQQTLVALTVITCAMACTLCRYAASRGERNWAFVFCLLSTLMGLFFKPAFDEAGRLLDGVEHNGVPEYQRSPHGGAALSGRGEG